MDARGQARASTLLLSLVWMGAEGAIGITAGIIAGSIALIGFGIDSGDRGRRQPGDRLALHRTSTPLPHRRGCAQKLLAVQFFLLYHERQRALACGLE